MKITYLVCDGPVNETRLFQTIAAAADEAKEWAESAQAPIYIFSLQGCMKPAKPPIVWEGSEY